MVELEDRYAAIVIMKWQRIGLDALEDDEDAVAQIQNCFRDQGCGADDDNAIDAQLTELVSTTPLETPAFYQTLPVTPSESMAVWAEIKLECREAPTLETEPEIEIEAEQADIDPNLENTSPENESEAAEADAPEPEEMAEEIDSDTATFLSDSAAGFEDGQTPQAIKTSDLTAEQARARLDTAAASMASGDVDRAIPLLRDACLFDVSTTQSSIACDTLLDVYEVNTRQGREPISGSTYLTFSEELCGFGYIQGCHNMALYLRAANTTGAYERGVAFTGQACDLGDAGACATLASDHIEGRTHDQNLEFARSALRRSCNLGRRESCRELADLYVRGVGGEADNQLALEAVAMACPDAGAQNPDLCVSAADFLLINMEAGEDRATQIRTYIKRACEIGHDIGCAWYAEDLELGIGGQADPQGAREARLTACEYGDQKSCNPRS
ncbi:MAG: tetratricopeptide repeat protein [Henriciella sp.]